MKNRLSFFVIGLLANCLVNGQILSADEIREAADSDFPAALIELMEFMQIPNIGSDPEQVAQNLAWCKKRFEGLDFSTQMIETPAAPLLFAEKRISPEKRTVLFYLQIDGQPVDPSEWDQQHPFTPVIKYEEDDGKWKAISWDGNSLPKPEWRVFGRSASDSKGPAIAFIRALDHFHSSDLSPAFNIKVVMDFQEELGSPSLPGAVREHRDLFKADLILIMDGTRHISNWPTLTYGARGIATATITVFGPSSPLHSGQYGNYAPNPVFEAGRLISSLKDPQGRTLIKGFYDGIDLSEEDKVALRSLPEDEESLRLRLGISEHEAVGENYQESLQYPSLNIRGLRSGWVGKEVRTIIPDKVEIELDMRLVPETPGEHMVQLLKDHISSKGFYLIDSLPTQEERKTYPKLARLEYRLGSLPFRTEMNSEAGRYLNKALGRIFGDRIANMRTTGGSQPIAPFVRSLGIPAVSIRIPNPDNNIHAPNENLRVGNLLEGIMTCIAILNEPF